MTRTPVLPFIARRRLALLSLLSLLLALSGATRGAADQDSVKPVSLRLRDVKTVFVGSFGTGEGADLIRAKVLAALVKSGRLDVVESPERADAILTGSGEVTKDARYTQGQGETKDTATAAVRLVGRADQKILWADEASTGLFVFGSATSSAANGIVKKLLAAIEKDRK